MKLIKRCLIIISILLNISLIFSNCYTYNKLNEELNTYKLSVELLKENNKREWNLTNEQKEELLVEYSRARETNLIKAQYMIDSYNFLYEYELSIDKNLLLQGKLYTPIYWNS